MCELNPTRFSPVLSVQKWGLELFRAEQADEPYAFRTGVQDYVLRSEGGGAETATLDWDAALLAGMGKFPREITFAAFSPDSQLIFTAAMDSTAKLWDAHDNAQRKFLTGHTKPIQFAAFSPDNKWLITASQDKTAMVWPLDSAVPAITLASRPTADRCHCV